LGLPVVLGPVGAAWRYRRECRYCCNSESNTLLWSWLPVQSTTLFQGSPLSLNLQNSKWGVPWLTGDF